MILVMMMMMRMMMIMTTTTLLFSMHDLNLYRGRWLLIDACDNVYAICFAGAAVEASSVRGI